MGSSKTSASKSKPSAQKTAKSGSKLASMLKGAKQALLGDAKKKASSHSGAKAKVDGKKPGKADSKIVAKGKAAAAPKPVTKPGAKPAAKPEDTKKHAAAPAKPAGKASAAKAASAPVAVKGGKAAKASAPAAATGKKAGASAKGSGLARGAHADSSHETVCREVACEGLATSGGYCRLHYIKNWKKIKRKELILKEKKLNQYIEELVAKYPDKYIEAIRQDLANDKEFAKVIYDLDLDESVDDFEAEGGESVDGLIDNIKREFEDEGEAF